ncbi:signal peptide peptidase SppA [Pelomonas sp. KK5]|uniref:signal peptide peptidase SppA n=1 Tax=Pelomonas sp. KK5 TaxID=1855730 RepID=UPI00097C7E9D|nr:signal peptide peptidase SppA [Pelomonas sp. KK5]
MSLKSVFRPIGWFFSRTWWLLDGLRRAILNLLLLIVLVILVVAIVRHGPKPLQPKTALVLNLGGRLVEQYAGNARDRAMAELRGEHVPAQTRLRDVLRAMDAATTDDKIGLLVLDLDDFDSAGLSGLHEVAAAVDRFKAAGKPVLAYGDGYSQRGYYLAARASEIYMHPMGSVQLAGFGGYRTYYKDALDRLGISANVLRVGTYKNAAEPYFANGPSKATLEADAALYGELWSGFTSAIETARKLPKGRIDADIAALPQQLAAVKGDTAQLALQQKLIDGVKTRDEMRELLMQRGAKSDDGKTYRQVSLAGYQGHVKPELNTTSPDYVAVVVAEGGISDGDAGPGKIGGDSTARLVRQVREDEHAKALVLRVNSPGGSAFASEIVRREVELLKKAGKPVVVSMGDVAASGGYWISMAADQVIADPGTITGSIGVFGMLPTADKLLDKLSLHTGGTTTTWLAQAYDPRRPLDPRMAEAVQLGINHIYDEFTERAAAARKKPVAEIDAVAQGRVWTGAQALERGLIDRTGSYEDALKAAAKLAKLDDGKSKPRIVYIEREPSRSERLLAGLSDVLAPAMVDAIGAQLGVPALPKLPPVLQQAGQDLAWLAELGQAKAGGRPFNTVVHCLCAAP